MLEKVKLKRKKKFDISCNFDRIAIRAISRENQIQESRRGSKTTRRNVSLMTKQKQNK